MWPFKRKSADQATVPTEIQEYYETTKRDRTGIAWLLALGTLLVTIVLALGLFFGGRWAYRTIADGDEESTPETTQSDTSDSDVAQNPVGTQDDTNTSTPTPSPTTTPSPGTSPAPEDQPQTSSTSTNIPNTGTNLPNTGPGDTLALFVIVSLAGTLAHRVITARRYSR